MKVFKNVNVYLPEKGIVKTSVIFDKTILNIGEEPTDKYEFIDIPDDAVVLPGFIDQHIHGSASADAMDGTLEALITIADSIACEGVTSFLATTMTQSPENISKAMTAVNEYRLSDRKDGAELLGIHLEGPYINKNKAGAQPAEYIVSPDIEQFKHYNELSGNSIKVVTLAPEMENAGEFIKYLKDNDIRASIGHTSAKYVDLVHAINCGASQVTHTYNAQSAYTHREIGVVGGALLRDELACEIICDLIHVSVPAIKMLIKNKPHDKIVLITDAMRAKNLGDTISELGGQTVYVKNGEARLIDGTLAGSVLKLNQGLQNVVMECGVQFDEAVEFVSANPAKNLGIYDIVGSIEVGKKANFAVLDKNTFEVLYTIREGKIIYKR